MGAKGPLGVGLMWAVKKAASKAAGHSREATERRLRWRISQQVGEDYTSNQVANMRFGVWAFVKNSNYLNCYFLTFCQNNVAFIVALVLFMVPFHFIPLIRSTCIFWLINCTNPLTMICKKSTKLQKARLTSVIQLLVSLEESLWGSEIFWRVVRSISALWEDVHFCRYANRAIIIDGCIDPFYRDIMELQWL